MIARLGWGFVFGLSASVAGLGSLAEAKETRRPNVVFILIDDLGWRDLGCYGSTFYETPNVDQLAAEAMRFTQAYAAAPVCSPARASILTGRNPARLGFSGHITAILKYRHPDNARILPPRDHMRLRLSEVTLAEALGPLGYASASIGKWHLGDEAHWPTAQGFDANIAGYTHGSPPSYFYPYRNPEKTWNPTIPTLDGGREGEYLPDRLTDEAIRFIEANRQRPFFLYLSLFAVHTPLQAPEPLVQKYREKLKDDRSQKNATYAAMIESVDQNVGRLMRALERLKLDERTIVIFFSDNGGLSRVTNNAPLRGGKQELYEGGIRVPLIVRWPGRIKAGSVSDAAVISDDLFPTILEMVGAKPPEKTVLDGTRLVPVLTGQGRLRRRKLFWYYPQYARRPGVVMRDGDFKLIEHYDPPDVELYNLSDDMGETIDLADRMPERVRDMRAAVDAWLDQVGAIRHTPNPDYRPR